MNTKTIYLIVALFIILIVGMVIFTYIAKKSIDVEQVPTPIDEAPDITYPYGIERIDAKHFYRNGTHIIVGSIMLPTPCDLLEGNARVAESMPEQITFDFTVINNAEVCAQVVTEQRFRVEAVASESASMTATIMGTPVTLNLIPAAASENPDDFEIFIKG